MSRYSRILTTIIDEFKDTFHVLQPFIHFMFENPLLLYGILVIAILAELLRLPPLLDETDEGLSNRLSLLVLLIVAGV